MREKGGGATTKREGGSYFTGSIIYYMIQSSQGRELRGGIGNQDKKHHKQEQFRAPR